MKTDQKKAPPEAEIDALEIKLERIPADNLAEVTATLDRVRTTAEKLVGKIAEATEKLENGEISYGQFESMAGFRCRPGCSRFKQSSACFRRADGGSCPEYGRQCQTFRLKTLL